MNVPGFTPEAMQFVDKLLYAEAPDPRLGKCGLRSKDKIGTKQLTSAQQAAARDRVGQTTNEPTSVRSEAGKRAAETRKKCQASRVSV
jgi:hypothetical protein